jgi:PAS domain S-box-containing protein
MTTQRLDSRSERSVMAAFAWLPVAGFATAVVVLVWRPTESAWNPPALLLALNTLFLTTISFLVTIIASQSYLTGQGGWALLLGGGTLALGFGAVLAGLPPGRNDPNYTATVYNASALLASICHLGSAGWAWRQQQQPRRPSGLPMALFFPSIIVLIILGTAAVREGLVPPFFLEDGGGATALNRSVLWTAATFFAVSAGLNYLSSHSAFLRWYALALTLLAVGLVAVSLQTHFGTALNWIGRSAQYLGGVYMLIAVISAVRQGHGWTVSLERALQRSEARYQSLVELSPDAVFVNRGGRITFANPTAVRLFGVASADDLLGRSPFELFHPDYHPIMSERIQTLLEGRAVPLIEARIRQMNGGFRDVEVTAAPFDDQEGRAIQVVLRDVTERKRAEETLRESEQRLHEAQELLEAVTLGTEVLIATVDRDFRYTFFNERHHRELKRLTGKDTALGMSLMEVLADTPEERDKALVLWRRAMQGETVAQTLMFGDPGRYRRWYNTRHTPIRDASGAVVGAGEVTSDVTEAMRAQEALRASEECLRLALDAGAMATWDWHIPGGEVTWNDEHYRMLGYEVGGVKPSYRAWVDRVHPDDAAATEAILRQSMERGTDYSTDFRVLGAHGTVRWVEARGRFERDSAGQAIRSYGVMLNITTRKQAEAALQESEARYRDLVQNANSAIIRWRADGTIAFFNEYAQEFFGWSADEVYGKHVSLLVPERESTGADLAGLVEDVVNHPDRYVNNINENVCQDGRRVWMTWTNRAVRDESGQVTEILAIGNDITERIRAEEALRRERDFTSAVLDNTGSLVVVIDREGRITRFNRACEAITGYALGEVSGRVFWEFLVPQDELPGVKETWDALTAGDFPNQHENHWVAKDGSRHLIAWSNTAIVTLQGDVEYIIGTGLDVTQRKIREERIARLTNLYAVLSRVNEMIVRTPDERLLYEGVCRIVAEEGRFPLVWVGRIDGREVAPAAWHGQAGDYLKEIRVEVDGELGTGPTGTCIREERPVVNDDFDVNLSTAPWRTSAMRYGFRASAAFPLHRQGQVVGALTLYATQPGVFDAEQLGLLGSLCADISYALDAMREEKLRAEAESGLRQRTAELKQLTETLEQRVRERTAELERMNEASRDLSSRLLSAQEEERKRVAGEIHDAIGSCLSAVKFSVESTVQRIGETAPVTPESLRAIIPVVQESIDECRRIQTDLRPSMLDDLGFLPTLSWFCRRFQTIYSGIRIEQEIGVEEDEIPNDLKIVMYRIVQEAVNNLSKHSGADLVRVSIGRRDGRLDLAIRDNGRGFEVGEVLAAKRTERGLGLSTMQERAELSGGSFSIESSSGQGTTVRASWPLQDQHI